MDDTGNQSGNLYEIYYLKEAEVRLLLAGLGQSMWYGLFSGPDDGGEQKPRTVNRLLAGLYEKGVIDWNGNQPVIRQPFSGIFASMLDQGRCVIIQMPEGGAIHCCYLSIQWVVVTRKSQREADTMGLARLSVTEWLKFVEAQVWQLEEGQRLDLVCRGSTDGQIYQRLGIIRKGIRSGYLEWETDGRGRIRWTQEELTKRIFPLLWPEGGTEPVPDEGERRRNDTDGCIYTSSR